MQHATDLWRLPVAGEELLFACRQQRAVLALDNIQVKVRGGGFLLEADSSEIWPSPGDDRPLSLLHSGGWQALLCPSRLTRLPLQVIHCGNGQVKAAYSSWGKGIRVASFSLPECTRSP